MIVFIFYLFFPVPAKAVENDYSAESIQSFITHLISKNEYYRAYVELQRLNSYYPGFLQKDKNYITELYLLFNGGRYNELLNKEYSKNDLNVKAVHTVFNIDVLFNKSDFLRAGKLLESAGLFSGSKDVEFYLYKRTILSYLLLKKIDEAKNIFNIRNKSYKEFDFTIHKFDELIDYTDAAYDSMKNPYSAMALGIIPGLGYAYSGQIETGIIAFILISAMSTITYFSFETDNKPIGVFFGLATTFFYGGSIIGGYLGSRSYNREAESGLRDTLSQRMNLNNDREEILNRYGVMSVEK